MDVISVNSASKSMMAPSKADQPKSNTKRTKKNEQGNLVRTDTMPANKSMAGIDILDSKISEQRSLTNKSKNVEEKEVQDILNMMNEFMEDINTNIHFSVHKDTERLMMRVVDQHTGEVLKEIPTEEMMDLMARIQNRVGVLLDKKI